MKTPAPVILTLNGDSSSIRFAVFEAGSSLERRMHGALASIGSAAAWRHFTDVHGDDHQDPCPEAADPARAATGLLDWLAKQMTFDAVSAVGHRVVHGMARTDPELATRSLVDELQSMSWVNPDHVASDVAPIDAVHARGIPCRPRRSRPRRRFPSRIAARRSRWSENKRGFACPLIHKPPARAASRPVRVRATSVATRLGAMRRAGDSRWGFNRWPCALLRGCSGHVLAAVTRLKATRDLFTSSGGCMCASAQIQDRSFAAHCTPQIHPSASHRTPQSEASIKAR